MYSPRRKPALVQTASDNQAASMPVDDDGVRLLGSVLQNLGYQDARFEVMAEDCLKAKFVSVERLELADCHD